MITPLLIAIFVSFLISTILTPLVKNIFHQLNFLEDPIVKQKKVHNATALSVVPRGGGIPIFISVAIPLLFLLPDKKILGIIVASALALAIGVWDDIKDISPKIRLVSNLLVSLIVVASGIGIAYISNPINGGVFDLSPFQITFGQHSIWVVSDLLAVFWIIACMNIVGWSAGVEGQLPGFVSVSAFFIGLVSLRFASDPNQMAVAVLAGAVTGAYLGFFPYNFFPQQIMPGYSGKSLAGLFLAILGVLSGAKLATVILLLGVPIIDAFFVIIKRVASGRSPLVGGPDHLHHSLLKSGWSRQQISILYLFFSFSLGVISLFLNSSQKFYFFIGLAVILLGILLKVSRRI